MDILLPKLYKEYGQYSNWRQLPSESDGLKPVERRILFAAHQIARKKLTKSARVDGHVIGHYHPHGSVYGSIVQLVRQGFLVGQGNFGCNIGVDPVGAAASRYTEVRMPESTTQLAFQHLKHVEWKQNELGEQEPNNLPVKFPMCLLGHDYTQGIGFGYKTLIPCYSINHLYSRLKWLLKFIKTKPIIAPITDCEIISHPRVLEELLINGEAKIEVKGVIELDYRTNMATLKSWPPGRKFESILKKFQPELDSNAIGFSDLSTTETKIVFKVLRERNRDKIFNNFVKKLQKVTVGTISFSTLVTDKDGIVKKKGVDHWLLETYFKFKDINLKMLKYSIRALNNQIEEYKLLEAIRPHLSDSIGKKHDLDHTISLTSHQTQIPQDTIKGLVQKYKIQKLLTLNTDTQALKNQTHLLSQNVKNISDFTIEQYGE